MRTPKQTEAIIQSGPWVKHSGITLNMFHKLSPGLLTGAFCIGWGLSGSFLRLVPLGGLLTVFAVTLVIQQFILRQRMDQPQLSMEMGADTYRASTSSDPPSGIRASKIYFSRYTWAATVLAFSASLLGMLAVASYSLVSALCCVNSVFVYSAFVLALLVSILFYSNEVVPQTEALIRNAIDASFASTVKHIKRALAAVGAFAVLLTAGATSSILFCITQDNDGDADLLKGLLYMHSITLICAIFHMYATYHLLSAHVQESYAKELAKFSSGVSLYLSTYSTMILIFIHVPATVIASFKLSDGKGFLPADQIILLLGPAILGVVGTFLIERNKE